MKLIKMYQTVTWSLFFQRETGRRPLEARKYKVNFEGFCELWLHSERQKIRNMVSRQSRFDSGNFFAVSLMLSADEGGKWRDLSTN